MRFAPEQTRVIKIAVARELTPDAFIWLLGSRVDDESLARFPADFLPPAIYALLATVR